MADQFSDYAASPMSFGTVGVMVTPNNSTDLAVGAKAVEVTSISGGTTLKVLPANNADGEWITYSGVVVGFAPGFRVRRVHTDTNCSVVAISG